MPIEFVSLISYLDISLLSTCLAYMYVWCFNISGYNTGLIKEASTHSTCHSQDVYLLLAHLFYFVYESVFL